MKNNQNNIDNLSDEKVMNLSDKELEELNQKIIFVRDGMPGEWLGYAEELMDSAELMWENKERGLRAELWGTQNPKGDGMAVKESKKVSTISRTYFLLVGFAIENLFKGFIVCQNPSNITSGKLSKNLKSHKLLVLAQKVPEIKLTKEENKICKKIEEAIPYWGRYPIPLDYNGITPDIGVTLEIRNTIKEMFDRISRKLYDKIKNGWDSGVGAKSMKYQSKRYGDDINFKVKLIK